MKSCITDHQLIIDSDDPIPTPDAQNPPPVKVGSISIVESTLLRPVTITPRTKLTESSFKGATGLEMLRFQSNPAWPYNEWGRSIIYNANPNAKSDECSSKELEVLYRQLRTGMEESKAGPAAADFFYGEMEARRDHTRRQGKNAKIDRWLEDIKTGNILRAYADRLRSHHWNLANYRLSTPPLNRILSLRWWQLTLYKFAAGYGVRPWRAFACYIGTVLAIAILFSYFHGQLIYTVDNCQNTAPKVDSFWPALAFSLRNSINLFKAPDTCIHHWGIISLVIGRLLGVAFLALAVLGLRSHVER